MARPVEASALLTEGENHAVTYYSRLSRHLNLAIKNTVPDSPVAAIEIEVGLSPLEAPYNSVRVYKNPAATASMAALEEKFINKSNTKGPIEGSPMHNVLTGMGVQDVRGYEILPDDLAGFVKSRDIVAAHACLEDAPKSLGKSLDSLQAKLTQSLFLARARKALSDGVVLSKSETPKT